MPLTHTTFRIQDAIFWLALVASIGYQHAATAEKKGELELAVVDQDTKESIAARLRILNSVGRMPRMRNVVRQGFDVTFDGSLTIELPPGRYTFSLDHGPHFHQRTGHLKVDRDGFDQKTLDLPRIADLRKEGWFSGDLLVRRQPEDLPLLLRAEELDLAVVSSWSVGATSKLRAKKGSSEKMPDGAFVDFAGGALSTNGGTLLVANLPQAADPSALPTATHTFARQLRKDEGAHVAVLEAFAWDLPMLVAHDLVDSVVVLNPFQRLEGDVKSIKRGRPHDERRYERAGGLGRYAQDIYFRLLNCGLRIPPSAASGSGNCDSPPGYNRTYVFCGQDFTPKTWWRNLEKGKVVVSNGPLLRVRANGELPGHVFQAEAGREVTLDIQCQLATRQKIDYLEIVKNGRVTESVRLDEWAKKQGRLPLVRFDESGWMLVRVIANTQESFRCGFSAPFYVEIGKAPYISKDAAQFFLDWVYARAREIRRSARDSSEVTKRLTPHREARDFWMRLVEESTAP